MRRFSFIAIFSVVAIFCASIGAGAQTSVADRYLISAKAGGVNHVEGAVTIARANGTAGVLLKRDRVEVGDRVTTGSDGRAEILLNPGSYIRIAGNTSFEFGTTDLEDLQLKLDSGTAIFEVFAADEFRVSIFTPKGKVALVDTGIYRVDVSPNGIALLSVVKGKAEVGDKTATLVKEGRTGTVGTETVAVAKFDKGKRDAFAQWSKDRSKELTAVSSALKDRQLSTALLGGFRTGRYSIYSSFGLWVFDASFGGYCFLPFGNGWRSPYGHWYYNGIYWQYMPRYGNPTWTPINPVTPRTKSNGRLSEDNGSTSTRQAKEPGGRIRLDQEVPPFLKVGRGLDRDDRGFGGSVFNTKGDFDMSIPSRSQPMSVPSGGQTIVSPPASTGKTPSDVIKN